MLAPMQGAGIISILDEETGASETGRKGAGASTFKEQYSQGHEVNLSERNEFRWALSFH